MQEEPIVMPRLEARNLAIVRMRETGMTYARIGNIFCLHRNSVQKIYLKTVKGVYEREGKSIDSAYTEAWVRRRGDR